MGIRLFQVPASACTVPPDAPASQRSWLSWLVFCHRFQADIAFDGEELARRALDRCGRVRLFKVRCPTLLHPSNWHAACVCWRSQQLARGMCMPPRRSLVVHSRMWSPNLCPAAALLPRAASCFAGRLPRGTQHELPACRTNSRYCPAVSGAVVLCCGYCCLQALDAAIRRHDPHALDALLMQFAAVIVSTTGAEVDRMEREIMVRAAGAGAGVLWGGSSLGQASCHWLSRGFAGGQRPPLAGSL